MGGDGQALSNKRRILEKSRAFLTPEELRKGDEEPSDAVQSRKQLKILQWTHCALSLEPLETPVVFDLRGRLYSKKSVLDSIMEKQSPSKQGDESKSADIKITKLSDVCEVSNVEDGVGGKVSIRCPLTGYDAAAGVRDFVGFWGCGHVCWAASNRSGMERSTVDEPPSATSGERSPECPCCGEVSFAVPLVLKSESDEVKQFRRLRPLQRAFRKRKRSDQ
uniref:Uncharacterized protein TCIL3000_10_12520 n=1 Tax=Trypanosoma congolense (strain IL3000) TaxID=1068625 RepID=G0UYK3_TRYCI|nr:unnamed protein product [Trypanosoma congolense IL3000]